MPRCSDAGLAWKAISERSERTARDGLRAVRVGPSQLARAFRARSSNQRGGAYTKRETTDAHSGLERVGRGRAHRCFELCILAQFRQPLLHGCFLLVREPLIIVASVTLLVESDVRRHRLVE